MAGPIPAGASPFAAQAPAGFRGAIGTTDDLGTSCGPKRFATTRVGPSVTPVPEARAAGGGGTRATVASTSAGFRPDSGGVWWVTRP